MARMLAVVVVDAPLMSRYVNVSDEMPEAITTGCASMPISRRVRFPELNVYVTCSPRFVVVLVPSELRTTFATAPLVGIPVVPFQSALQSFWIVKVVADWAVMASNPVIAGLPVPQVGQ